LRNEGITREGEIIYLGQIEEKENISPYKRIISKSRVWISFFAMA